MYNEELIYRYRLYRKNGICKRKYITRNLNSESDKSGNKEVQKAINKGL
ncbi:hypothetical protein [uncultured Clostridium sp.]|nr:hypothetical protein [uncultured Clostridium sp.]